MSCREFKLYGVVVLFIYNSELTKYSKTYKRINGLSVFVDLVVARAEVVFFI